jgi:uncharacterized protein YbjQ (UPF0145 family)
MCILISQCIVDSSPREREREREIEKRERLKREREREALENLAHVTRNLSAYALQGLRTNIRAFISTDNLYLYVILKGSMLRINFPK